MVGLAAWVIGLVALPAPLVSRIFLLAPLVIVPRLLQLLPERAWAPRLAGWPALLAGLALPVAVALPAGPLAAACTLPWLLVTGLAAVAAARHGLPALPGVLHPHRAEELGVDASLAFLGVGAIFLAFDRLGYQPMGFSATIIFLTAVHFHFAGFGLLGLTSRIAASRPWLRAPVLGLIVGTLVTATGFVTTSDAVNAVGASLVGLSGIGAGLGLLSERVPSPRRWGLAIAGAALLVAMPMAIAWSVAILFDVAFVDLDTMVRTHGALNAAAVALATMASRPTP